MLFVTTSLKKTFLFLCVFIYFKTFAQNNIPILETGGTSMPNEWIDNITGHRVIKLINRAGINSSFYFHNNPFIISPDKKNDKMIFFGTTNGVKNAYTVNLENKEVTQITFSETSIGAEIVGHKYNNLYFQKQYRYMSPTLKLRKQN
jgi:oligogalacturonide lyase